MEAPAGMSAQWILNEEKTKKRDRTAREWLKWDEVATNIIDYMELALCGFRYLGHILIESIIFLPHRLYETHLMLDRFNLILFSIELSCQHFRVDCCFTATHRTPASASLVKAEGGNSMNNRFTCHIMIWRVGRQIKIRLLLSIESNFILAINILLQTCLYSSQSHAGAWKLHGGSQRTCFVRKCRRP